MREKMLCPSAFGGVLNVRRYVSQVINENAPCTKVKVHGMTRAAMRFRPVSCIIYALIHRFDA